MTTGLLGRAAAGHPVDVASGIMFNAWDDFAVPGRVQLGFTRHYSTGVLDRPPGPLGPGWTHDFLLRLEETADGYQFDGPGAVRVVFPKPPGGLVPGEPVRILGAFHELTREAAALVVTTWNVETLEVWRYVFPGGPAPGPRAARAVEDVTGQGVDLEYDRAGRVALARQRREGRALRLRYGPGGLLTHVLFVPLAGDERVVATFGYADGRLASVADPLGAADRYEYDAAGRMTREVGRGGGVFAFRYDARGRCVSSTGLDDYDRTELRYTDNIGLTAVTNSLGDTTHYFWNPLGQVARVVTPLGSTTLTEYDAEARVAAVTAPNGGTTRFDYDAAGNRCLITDPTGRVVAQVFDARRLRVGCVDPGGGAWGWEYDGRGHLVGMTDPLGGRLGLVLNAFGEVVEATDPRGSRLFIRWTDRGDLDGTTDREGNVTEYRCNEYGLLRRIVEPPGLVTEAFYDAALRLVRVVRPDGSEVRAGYTADGDESTAVDPAGGVTRCRYGTCHRLSELTDPLGRTTRYRWGTEPGHLLDITNEKGEVYRFEYDADGRRVVEVNFAGRRTEFLYGPGAALEAVVTDGGRTTYRRDLLDRVVGVVEPDGGAVEFEYDRLGKLVRAADGRGTVLLERDPLGRVVAEVSNGRTVRSRYDPNSNRVERECDLGPPVRYDFDRSDRWVGVKVGTRAAVGLTRGPTGKEVERRLGPGLALTQEFDALGRLTRQHLPPARPADPGGFTRPLVHRDFRYLPTDDLESVSDDRWGEAVYDHDPAGQLTRSRSAAGDEAFVYDPAGNPVRITRAGGEAADPPADLTLLYGPGSRLEETSDRRLEYDRDDRPVRATAPAAAGGGRVETWEFAWGGDGMLSSVRRPDGAVWTYEYDAFSRRTAKVGPAGRTEYVWDADQPAYVVGPDGRVTTWVFEVDGEAPVVGLTPDGPEFCITDVVGGVRELVNEAGEVVWAELPRAWGGTGPGFGAGHCPFRFPGQWQDLETGFHYNRFRYYDPQTGRYLSPDPARLAGGLNPFQYGPSPLMWLDPFGLQVTNVQNVNGRQYTYDQDASGRVVRAEGPLCNPNRVTDQQRDPNAQRRLSGGTGYDAGHLLGNEFGGPGGGDNLVLMCSSMNQRGSWRKMERQIKGFTRTGTNVRMEVHVEYRGQNGKIPTKFTCKVTYTDRKGKQQTKTYTHTNCGPR